MGNTPKGLPPVGEQKVDTNKPEGLPSIPESRRRSALDRLRICPKCNKEGRVVSNSLGRSVTCNPCKFSWPISTLPMDQMTKPEDTLRGLSKQTVVEPDWDMAYDDEIGGKHGPPERR
jgi:hypothetical protein